MIHLITTIDQYVLEQLYALRTVPVTMVFIDISEFGRTEIIIGFTAAISLWLGLKRRYADIAGLAASVAGSAVTILALKYLIHRPRPDFMYQAYPEGPYYSFPSAHAGLSMALYGFTAYLLIQSFPTRWRQVATALLPVLILLVGFSRLYLGVHYVSDVMAGFAIGALFVWIGTFVRIYILKLLDSRRG